MCALCVYVVYDDLNQKDFSNNITIVRDFDMNCFFSALKREMLQIL